IQGSGWAILAYEPIGGNLVIEQFYDQQNGVPVATTPLFMLDMWEHAFYLDYQNVKPDYVKAIWNIVNWADVQARFEAARSGAFGFAKPYYERNPVRPVAPTLIFKASFAIRQNIHCVLNKKLSRTWLRC